MTVPLTGVVPVVPTVFNDDETIDLDGTARVVDYLTIARTLMGHIAGRRPWPFRHRQ